MPLFSSHHKGLRAVAWLEDLLKRRYSCCDLHFLLFMGTSVLPERYIAVRSIYAVVLLSQILDLQCVDRVHNDRLTAPV